jgi:ATP-dependent Clp protease, protease subunit
MKTNRLYQLLAANRGVTRSNRIVVNKADGQDAEATVYLYDVIDPYWGIGAQQFCKDLAAIDASTIHLRINSPGGDVFEARAMATALREHKAKVIAHVDGLAASCASWIALAGDEVEIARGAFFMIHRSWSFAMGNAEDLKTTAGVLEKIDDELVAEYVRETKSGEEQLRAWINAETWFTADEAVEHGFADRLAPDAPKDQTTWDVSAFAHAPKDLLERPANVAAAKTKAESEHAQRVRGFRIRERQFA